jgi:acyl-CoA thioesterase YciA
MTDRNVSIRVVMLPRDTNPMGTIFGGVILSYIDLAGGTEARRHSDRRFVTKLMQNVDFVAPVHLGDLVTFYTRTLRIGTSSVTVQIDVEAERLGPHGNRESVPVTAAQVVYVAIDDYGKPTPVSEDRSP